MLAYWDTSALAKVYVRELGTVEALQCAGTYAVVSSELLPVEMRSMLYRRKLGGGHPVDGEWPATEERLAAHRASWELAPLSAPILARAENLVGSSAVRTLVALHIATAEDMQLGFGVEMPFITADKRQAEAAAAVGLQVQFIGGE